MRYYNVVVGERVFRTYYDKQKALACLESVACFYGPTGYLITLRYNNWKRVAGAPVYRYGKEVKE